LEDLKVSFNDSAKAVFGSGWAWLIIDNNGRLKTSWTFNQDNPIMDIAENQGMPILCLDVWEHAYYMKNQNRRTEYIDAFWNVVNWDVVSKRYERHKDKNYL
jgi:Fe-Mn family superoxide dismutase